MNIKLAVLFAIIAIASAARERVLYEAFSGLNCQAADLGSIVVRFEDDDQPRFDCTNYEATSYRSTAGAPIPEAESDWAYVSVQLSECPVTDAMEYTLYAGLPSKSCWTYNNFTVFVDGGNQALSINLRTNQCNEVDHLEDFSEREICRQVTSTYSLGSALGAIPIDFAPVAPPVAPVAPVAPPTTQQTPSSSPGTSQTNNAIATSALMTSFGLFVVLPLVL
jgi:hypothetical protein